MSVLERLRDALAPQYEVEREVASGGMGTVYLARDTVLDRRVAIKVHHPDLPNGSAAQRLLQEARILAQLKHPNVVSIYNAGKIDESFYYIMDFVEGETLEERLQRGPVTQGEALTLANDLLSALEAAHARGIVHRDIKPSNIFLVDDRALLGDFGIAKRSEGTRVGITEPGRQVGTPGYMAPEQVTGEEVTPQTDLYAFGMVFYEALTGRRWSLLTPVEESDWSGVPAEAARPLRRALALSPKDRWTDATSLRLALCRPESTAKGSRRSSIVWGAAAAAAVMVLVAGGLWSIDRARNTLSPIPSMSRVAVLPFSVRGSGDLDYLGEGMVDLLSTKLDGAGDLRSVDPRAILSLRARDGGGPLDLARSQSIARDLDADLFVLGNVVEVQGSVHLDASLYDSERDMEVVAQASVEGSADEIFSMVDGLAAQLLVGESGARRTQIAAVTTSSLDALKAYLEGERALRQGHYLPAAEAFERAVQADSTFALAWYRLSVAGDWLVRVDLVERGAEQAVRHGRRLSERDRRLLEATLAYAGGDFYEAERLQRGILSSYPDDIESWLRLGELIFHYGPFNGRPVAEAKEPFERILFYEPDDIDALNHLIRIAASTRETGELDALVDRFLELNPEADRAIEIRTLRAFVSKNAEMQEQVLNELGTVGDGELMLTAWAVASFTDSFDGARRVAEVATDPTRFRELRALGHAYLGFLNVAQGRWAEAKETLAIASALHAPISLEYRALLSTAPYVSIPTEELRAMRAELSAWDATAALPSGSPAGWVAANDEAHEHIRLYLLGLLSANLGDEAAARSYVSELNVLGGPAHVVALARDLARGVQAELELHGDNQAAALAVLESIEAKTWYGRMTTSPFYALDREHYLRAELLAAAGRDEEALEWYDAFAEASVYRLAYLAPSHLRRGEIYERLGEPDKAVLHYNRFLTLWDSPDPELRPLVEYVEGRLAELSSETLGD